MTPDFSLTIDGKPAGSQLLTRFLSMTLQDEAGIRSDKLTLRLIDDADVAPPRRGAVLEPAIGYRESSLTAQGRYIVDNVTRAGPPPTMTINARAANMREGLKSTKTRSWHKKKLGDIAKSIAAEHQLEVAIDQAAKTIEFAHLDQLGESDMQFLTRICEQEGLFFKPAGGKFILAKRSGDKTPSGKSIKPLPVSPQEILSYSLSVEERTAKQGAVSARFNDLEQAEPGSVTIGSGDPPKELPGIYANRQAALSAARAESAHAKRGAGQLELTLIGNPALMAGGKIVLSSHLPDSNGIWHLANVTHTLTGSEGYTTKVKADKN